MHAPPDPAAMKDFVVENLIPKKPETVDRDRRASALGKSLLGELTARLRGDIAPDLQLDLSAQAIGPISTAFGPLGNNGAIATFSQGEEQPFLAVALDGAALAFITSVLFGGDPSLAVDAADREPSAVEREVLGLTAGMIGKVLTDRGFTDLLEPTVLSVQEFTSAASEEFEAAVLAYTIKLEPNSGTLRIALPDIDNADTGEDGAVEDAGALEPSWEARFGDEIVRAHMRLEVHLPLEQSTLGLLAALRPGDVLPMPPENANGCVLAVRGQPVFTGQFGRLGDRYSIRIDEPCGRGETIVDDIIRSI